METHDKEFYPESVDADIDQFLQVNDQEEIVARPDIHLVHEVRDLYFGESQVLEHAWTRLSQQLQNSSREMPVSVPHYQNKKEKDLMKYQAISDHKKGRVMKRLSTIGLVLVAALLLASVVIALNLRQQSHTTSVTGNSGAATPGHVVYSSQKMDSGTSVSWSSDGKRVAVVGNDTNAAGGGTVEIWDALTGKHRVSLKLDADDILSMPQAWSPHDELLAIPTSKRMLIVNGQTGKIVTSYTVNTSPKLSAVFWGVAWSPDGKSIASAYGPKGADTPASRIQIWHPLTGIVSDTLSLPPHWNIGDISWSPDGADIAANMSKGASSITYQVQVWDVKTKQVVFQHVLPQPQYAVGSVWQPGTHNLAFSLIANGAFNTAVLQIWNVQTGRIVKSLSGIAADSMAWSPDGKEIAYDTSIGGGATAGVTLLNVTTDQKVYTYSVSAQGKQQVNIGVPAWSPDGTYIVTSESTSSLVSTSLPYGTHVSSCKNPTPTSLPNGHGFSCNKADIVTPTTFNRTQTWSIVKVWTA
jgi:WD40-like Beta Propeller Repeat